jgi:streptomycin 6-kinase
LNFVAPATRADGTPCVLKVSRRLGATRAEITALRLWQGVGAARVLEAAPERGALLLERLEPGTMLSEVDDDTATRVAAGLLRQLWLPARKPRDLETLRQRCAAYERNRAALSSGVAGFPKALFDTADRLRAELLRSSRQVVVLHGDLHHFNILRAERAEWLAIDPHGLVGDPCFDVCQFLRNPEPMPIEVNRRRVDVFCAELGLDRARTAAWCVVHAVLDACWSYEDGDPELAARVAYAEAMAEI